MAKEILELPIESIEPRPQVRSKSGLADDEIASLAQSIKESGGIHQPLLVRREGDRFPLIDGERRYRAAKLLGLKTLPAIIDDQPLTETEITHRQLVLDAQRVGLGLVERATAISRLMQETGWTAEQVARKLGQSSATISRTLTVLKLPDSIRTHVAEGRISADAAYMLSRVDDPAEQAQLAAQVTEGLLTRDALNRKLRRVHRAENAQRSGVTRITAALGSGRSVTFTGKGLTLDALIEWTEPLLSRAKKAKSQGLTLQTFVRTLKDQAAS